MLGVGRPRARKVAPKLGDNNAGLEKRKMSASATPFGLVSFCGGATS